MNRSRPTRLMCRVLALGGLALGPVALGCGAHDDAAAEGPITVTVVDGTDPAEDVPVLVFDQFGAHTETVLTDGFGVATPHMIEGGAALVVLEVSANFVSLETIVDLLPGDNLTYVRRPTGSVAPVTLNVQLAPLPGASAYGVRADCGTGFTIDPAQPVPVVLPEVCTTDNEVTITAYASAGGNQPALGFSVLEDFALTGNPIAVSMPPWTTDFTDLPVSVENIPDAATNTTVTSFPAFDGLIGYPFAIAEFMDPGTTESANLAIGGTGDTRVFTTGSTLPDGFVTLTIRDSSSPGAVTFDYATGLTAATSGALDMVNPRRPVATWLDGDATADQLLVVFGWTAGPANVIWPVTLPGNTPSPVTLPELPDSLTQYHPDLATVQNARVVHLEASYIGEYRDLVNIDNRTFRLPNDAQTWSTNSNLAIVTP